MESNRSSSVRRFARTGGRLVGHGAAIALGGVLMIVGLALSVPMVTLPIGLPVGLAGLLLFLWGAFTSFRGKRATA
jgi:hypothetical protein